jgi:hypothetical protein
VDEFVVDHEMYLTLDLYEMITIHCVSADARRG